MTVDIRVGDCRQLLRELPSESVQCVVTSPPYWGLRDYGMAGQLGLEKTPGEYVEHMVEVFRDIRRVLRADGTLWLNVGDSYGARGNSGGNNGLTNVQASSIREKGWPAPPPGLKDKDLVGVPWLLAFALRGDGWYLRAENIWAKRNGMPESVVDRPTRGHETVFLLTLSERYFYDGEAARTPAAPSSDTRLAQNVEAQEGSVRANGGAKTNGAMKAVRRRSATRYGHGGTSDSEIGPRNEGANLRSVWWLSSAQFREAHFAVMPESLAEICILAGSRIGDTILDPFLGAGTTALVADRLGRSCLGIELNPAYAEMAHRRIHDDAPLFSSAVLSSGTPE